MIRGVLWSATAVAAFLVVNYLITRFPPSSEAIISATPPVETPGQTDPFEPLAIPSGMQFTHARERPVFRPTRRPWTAPSAPAAPSLEPPEAAAVPVESPPAPQTQVQPIEMSLIGVHQEPNGARALVLRPGEPKPRWIRAGDIVDSWTVAVIEPGSISVTAGSETRTFDLYVQPPKVIE